MAVAGSPSKLRFLEVPKPPAALVLQKTGLFFLRQVLPSGVSDATVADLLSFLECDAARQLDTAHAEALRKVVERPEFLVVNCWRSVREVALLLGGALIRWALPVTTPRISTAQVGLRSIGFSHTAPRSPVAATQ